MLGRDNNGRSAPYSRPKMMHRRDRHLYLHNSPRTGMGVDRKHCLRSMNCSRGDLANHRQSGKVSAAVDATGGPGVWTGRPNWWSYDERESANVPYASAPIYRCPSGTGGWMVSTEQGSSGRTHMSVKPHDMPQKFAPVKLSRCALSILFARIVEKAATLRQMSRWLS